MKADVPKPAARKRRWLIGVLLVLFVLLGAGAIAIYTGFYNIAADLPHSQPVYWLFEKVRARSVAVRARDMVVPTDFNDAKSREAEMCSVCHLAPGMNGLIRERRNFGTELTSPQRRNSES
jgi:hypothetical protein